MLTCPSSRGVAGVRIMDGTSEDDETCKYWIWGCDFCVLAFLESSSGEKNNKMAFCSSFEYTDSSPEDFVDAETMLFELAMMEILVSGTESLLR